MNRKTKAPDDAATEEGAAAGTKMADFGTPVPNESATRARYHEQLVAAFVGGATVGEAARHAGVSRRTAQRWKAEHGQDVTEARRAILDGLHGRVQAALPKALVRLERIAAKSENEAVAVRAALGLWEVFGRVTDRMELEERLAALERGDRPGAVSITVVDPYAAPK